MGKITGFLEIEREDRTYEPAADRVRHYREFIIAAERGGDRAPSRPLHGLRHPLLPYGLSGQQPDPRLERPRLPFRLGGRRGEPALDQQLPRGDGPHLPRAVRGRLHAEHHRRAGHHQVHRMRHRRQGLRRGLGAASAAGDEDRQARGRSSAQVPPGLPRPSSSPAPATTCMSTRSTPIPAACSATAFPTSRWRNTSSSAA